MFWNYRWIIIHYVYYQFLKLMLLWKEKEKGVVKLLFYNTIIIRYINFEYRGVLFNHLHN